MKVLILTQDIPFYLPEYLKKIIEKNDSIDFQIVFLPPFSSTTQSIFYNVSFFGVAAFSYLVFRLFRLKILSFLGLKKGVKKYLRGYNIKFHKLKKVDSIESMKLVKEIKPDVILSLACPQKIPKIVIDYPPKGAFNIHSALLPKYRGVNAIFWAMLNGENKIGVTYHRINENFDEGSIVLQEPIDLMPDDTYHSLCLKVENMGSEMSVSFFKLLTNDKLEYTPQVESGKYYSFPHRMDRIKFYQKGNRFFNKWI